MEGKTEKYTFGPEEKDILEKLNKMESSVEGYIQERYQRELIKTKYYSEMVINTDKGPITLKNVFITEEQDPNGKVSYHFRWIKENKNGEKSIEENQADAVKALMTDKGFSDFKISLDFGGVQRAIIGTLL